MNKCTAGRPDLINSSDVNRAYSKGLMLFESSCSFAEQPTRLQGHKQIHQGGGSCDRSCNQSRLLEQPLCEYAISIHRNIAHEAQGQRDIYMSSDLFRSGPRPFCMLELDNAWLANHSHSGEGLASRPDLRRYRGVNGPRSKGHMLYEAADPSRSNQCVFKPTRKYQNDSHNNSGLIDQPLLQIGH